MRARRPWDPPEVARDLAQKLGAQREDPVDRRHLDHRRELHELGVLLTVAGPAAEAPTGVNASTEVCVGIP